MEHNSLIKDGCLPKDILYSELASSTQFVNTQFLRYKNVIKCDMSELNLFNWKSFTAYRANWRDLLDKQLLVTKEKTPTTLKTMII